MISGLLGGGNRLPGIFGDPIPQMAPQAPTPPPVQGPVSLPAAPAPRASIYDRIKQTLGMALGGPNDPSLTADQNAQAAQQARIMAGLGMLAASHNPAGNAPGLGEILLQGAMTGQQAGGALRQQAYMSTQEERVRQALEDPEVVGKLTPQQLAMIRLMPPREAAQMLAQLAFASPAEPKVVGEGGVLVSATGEELFRNEGTGAGGPDLPTDLEAILWSKDIDPAQMTPEQRADALAEYASLKDRGALNINLGDKSAQQEFANVNTLASAYDSAIADHQKIASSYLMVKASAQDPSPAGDISMIFAYMKMLDPASVVREGEQATASNAAGVPDRIRNLYNRAMQGTRLTPEQRADFVDRAGRLATQRRVQLGPIMERYRSRAATRSLDPDQFIYDPYAEVGLDSPASTSAFPLFEDVQ